MKHLRITARVDPEQAPEFFTLLANSTDIEEARVLDVTTTADGIDNLLIAIEGDATRFAERAPTAAGIESVDLSDADGNRAYALVVMRPQETPLFGALHRASSASGLVVRTPIVYRNGTMSGTAVGRSDTLQHALGDVPDAIDIHVEEIGRVRGRRDDPTAVLSDRQQEALEAAVRLGYYDQPRGGTHEDVAAELGCAPATASDHLQKAEAKLVHAAPDDLRRRE